MSYQCQGSTCISFAPAASHCLSQQPSVLKSPQLPHPRMMPQWGQPDYDFQESPIYILTKDERDNEKKNEKERMMRKVKKEYSHCLD